MFAKIKQWFYVYRVRARAWNFLCELNAEREEAYKEHRNFDLTVFGHKNSWDHSTGIPSFGINLYLKPFYLDTGGISSKGLLLILDAPPEGVPEGLTTLYYKSFLAKGVPLTYKSPLHLYEALDVLITECNILLRNEVLKSKGQRVGYLDTVLENFPTANSVLYEKIKTPCTMCGEEVTIIEAELELTTCGQCSTEYVKVGKEMIPVILGEGARTKLHESKMAKNALDREIRELVKAACK